MTTSALKAGVVVVLEGLDKTGKSTQAQALRQLLEPGSAEYVHMPRGVSAFTEETYSMLESEFRAPASGIAKQLAHLACHAETVPHLCHALKTRGVVLDRWWWSTIAYGWYSGDLKVEGLTEDVLRSLIEAIWSPISASVVFLFDKPHVGDARNSDPVRAGYLALAAEEKALTVRVPAGEQPRITDLILSELRSRDLLIEQVPRS